MSVLQVKTEIAFNELLNVVKQLDTVELEKLTAEVISLQAHRNTASYSKQESELILKINQGLPTTTQQRFNQLQTKRQAEQLNAQEQQELIDITEQQEHIDAERIKLIAELGKLRGNSIDAVMQSLGIETPKYA